LLSFASSGHDCVEDVLANPDRNAIGSLSSTALVADRYHHAAMLRLNIRNRHPNQLAKASASGSEDKDDPE
jgi:hypothetical protein